ncbi:MAG: pilus assembly FimT family protein [Kiritimatiellia bacterium]
MPARQKPASRAGFTLLELLIVITMMIFITVISVMNYFGAMRSAGMTTVSNNVFNSLLMARQRACLDGKPVVFYMLSATNYVIQEAVGTITKINPEGSGFAFFDQYGDVKSWDASLPLINMDRPGTTATITSCGLGILPTTCVDASGTSVAYDSPAFVFHVTTTGVWLEGDRYGIQVFAPQMLPNGFIFVPDPAIGAPSQRLVAFNPDGTINIDPTTGGLSLITVKETISGNSLTFTIDASGKIRQGR